MLIKGRVVAQGPPAAVLESPNADVQGFIRASGVEASRLQKRRARKAPEELAQVARARQREAAAAVKR
jgi:glycyl-tRNA synthetase beta subunit